MIFYEPRSTYIFSDSSTTWVRPLPSWIIDPKECYWTQKSYFTLNLSFEGSSRMYNIQLYIVHFIYIIPAVQNVKFRELSFIVIVASRLWFLFWFGSQAKNDTGVHQPDKTTIKGRFQNLFRESVRKGVKGVPPPLVCGHKSKICPPKSPFYT